MALLQSGKVYDIKIYYNYWTNWPTKEQFLNNFITEYKKQTKITNSEYSTIKSYYDENENEHKYFNLPYINDPLTTSKGNLYLCFEFGTRLVSSSGNYISSPYLMARRNQNEILDKFFWPASYLVVDLGNDTYRIKSSGFFGAYSGAYSDVNEDGCAWMHIDTRFLDSHKFYTIDVITFTDDIEEISSIKDVKNVYFSPTIFICDMVDQITEKHYDSIFTIKHTSGGISDLSNPTQTNGNILRGLGIAIDEDGIEKYAQNSFYPQLYDENDSSIVLQKLQFGRLKSNNIYITNRYKDNTLKTLTDNNKMSEYKDGWVQDILYKDDKKFIIGTNGGYSNDDWYSEDSHIYNLYIPVIKGDTIPKVLKPKLVPWSTGTDEEITAMINGYYDDVITIDDIKSVWKLGDKRKIHLNAMPATYVGETHEAQDIELQIIDFEHDDLVSSINEKTKALISIDQKDCLMNEEVRKLGYFDPDDDINWTEIGYMNPDGTAYNGWKDCKRRQWCNNIYLNSLPEYLKSLVKYTKHMIRYKDKNTNTNKIYYTYDYVFFCSEYELTGTTTITAAEGSRYALYTSHLWRRKNPTSPEGNSRYWTRSQYRSNPQNGFGFILANYYGSDIYKTTNGIIGIAPVMCL